MPLMTQLFNLYFKELTDKLISRFPKFPADPKEGQGPILQPW